MPTIKDDVYPSGHYTGATVNAQPATNTSGYTLIDYDALYPRLLSSLPAVRIE